MSTKFSQQNNIFMIRDSRSLVVHDFLPAGAYVLKFNPDIGFYLEITENFSLPEKLYGSVKKDSDRVLHTFSQRPNVTGMLLTGERGSGKTMLAKKVSLDGQALGMPTIIVNAPFNGDAFNTFIQAIEQDAILFFDEFEKVYDAKEQEQLLTLLDGTVMTHKLAIFTSNSKYKVNEHMQNRPGRIFYLKEYDGIDAQFIEEYCMDNLKSALVHHTPVVMQFATMFYAFNFDMLKAVVEEMNRYDESPQEAVKMLNAKPGFSAGNAVYDLTIITNMGQELISTSWNGSPLMEDSGWAYQYWVDGNGKMAENPSDLNNGQEITSQDVARLKLRRRTVNFTSENITGIEKNGTIHLMNSDGFAMKLVKLPPKKWNATNYMGRSDYADF